MERVATLIYKLLEQYQSQVGAGKMMMTTQMLLTELQQYEQASQNGVSNKVTVVIPSVVQAAPEQVANIPAAVPPVTVPPPAAMPAPPPPQPSYQQYQAYQPAASWTAPAAASSESPVRPIVPAAALYQPAPVVEETPAPQPAIPSVPPAGVQQNKGWQFDPVHDVPTLTHQETAPVYNINDRALVTEESLNERLKVEKIELGSVLQESPIRDLKKAIGINDRYLFINELFRGDETMYERSLKTINGFNILPEAQYWIQRELKVKLGWNEQSEAVFHFDQLVKRRFS